MCESGVSLWAWVLSPPSSQPWWAVSPRRRSKLVGSFSGELDTECVPLSLEGAAEAEQGAWPSSPSRGTSTEVRVGGDPVQKTAIERSGSGAKGEDVSELELWEMEAHDEIDSIGERVGVPGRPLVHGGLASNSECDARGSSGRFDLAVVWRWVECEGETETETETETEETDEVSGTVGGLLSQGIPVCMLLPSCATVEDVL